jgi:hypothetical protein
MLGAKTKALTRHKKGTDFPESLRKHLQVYYDMEPTGQPTILQDKSGYNNNATKNGTVGDATYQGRNVKQFTRQGSYELPKGVNVKYLYPFKYSGEIAKINLHQGITHDGTYWYATGSDTIKKFDSDFNVLITKVGVGAEHTGGNHLGDLAYYDGKLYIPSETFVNCTTFSNQKIAVFDATDLSYITSYDVSAQGEEVSALAVNPDDGIIYTSSYCTTNALQMYDLDTVEYLGNLATETISTKQGIDYYNSKLYIAGANAIYKVNKTSGVREGLLAYFPISGGHEGLKVIDETTIYTLIYNSVINETNLHLFKKDGIGWTIIIWVNLPYLPSTIPENQFEIFNTPNTTFNLNIYYKKTSNASLYFNITGVNGDGTTDTKAQIKETDGLLLKNTPMMITAVYDGQYAKLYLNDAKSGSVPQFDAGTDLRVIYDLGLGGQSIWPEKLLAGWVGELAILNKPLSGDEIIEVYNRTRGKYGV